MSTDRVELTCSDSQFGLVLRRRARPQLRRPVDFRSKYRRSDLHLHVAVPLRHRNDARRHHGHHLHGRQRQEEAIAYAARYFL